MTSIHGEISTKPMITNESKVALCHKGLWVIACPTLVKVKGEDSVTYIDNSIIIIDKIGCY